MVLMERPDNAGIFFIRLFVYLSMDITLRTQADGKIKKSMPFRTSFYSQNPLADGEGDYTSTH